MTDLRVLLFCDAMCKIVVLACLPLACLYSPAFCVPMTLGMGLMIYICIAYEKCYYRVFPRPFRTAAPPPRRRPMTAVTDYHLCDDWLALMRGVCETPAADLPRLVVADWLEERGTPVAEARARFVRAQVAFERLTPTTPFPNPEWDHLVLCQSAPRRNPTYPGGGVSLRSGPTPRCRCEPCRLLRTARKAWGRYGGGWYQNRQPFYALPGTLAYRRGFPYRLSLPLAAFMQHAADLFRAAPFTEVVLTDREPYWNGYGHSWFDRRRHRPSDDVPELAELPGVIYDRIPGSNPRYVHYDDPRHAVRSLSAACVRHARDAAGLPPLTV